MKTGSEIFITQLTVGEFGSMLRTIISEELRKKQAEDIEDKMLSPADVAKIFQPSVSLQTISTWTKKGMLKKYSAGGRRVFYKRSEVLNQISKMNNYDSI